MTQTLPDWCPGCDAFEIYEDASDIADIAAGLTEFLRSLHQSNLRKLDNLIGQICPDPYPCTPANIDEIAEGLSQIGHLPGIENLRDLFHGVPVSNKDPNKDLIAYLKPLVIVRVAELRVAADPSRANASSPADPPGSITHRFDGSYMSGTFHAGTITAGAYGFVINGKEGRATVSNSPSYQQGDVILKLNQTGPDWFSGQQICTDGNFYPVVGKRIAGGVLEMTSVGCTPSTWRMTPTTGASIP